MITTAVAITRRRLLPHGTRCLAAALPRHPFSTTPAADSSPPQDNLTPEQVRRIGVRHAEYRREHHSLKVDVPVHALDPTNPEVDPDNLRRKRLIYRSKQRGWLEVDLLMGSWAATHVPFLSKEEMDEYEAILNLETIDIYNFVNGKDTPPPYLQTAIMDRLKEYALGAPFGKADQQGYEEIKDKTNLI